MRVFVAGATGVLGRRAVKLLSEAGHDVTGVARSPEKSELVEKLGARPVALDVFDPPTVKAAVAGHDVVMNLATHIPAASKMSMIRNWRENDRLRTEASRTLVDGALAARASRYIQESIAFFYEDRGEAWADEDTPVDLPKHAQSCVEAEAQAARFTQAGGVGIALRFGMFYSPDSQQTRLQVKLARRGLSSFLGGKGQYQSIIALDDAASAVVAALEAPAGVYNIVDNEPLTKGEATHVLADAVGRKRLVRPPRAAIAASGLVLRSLMRSQRVSNRRFRDATGWKPAYPSAREGIPALVAAVSD